MGFEDLEARLKFALAHPKVKAKSHFKARLKEKTLKNYQRKHSPYQSFKGRFWFTRLVSVGAMSAFLLGMVGFFDLPFFSNRVVGEIESQGGVVEIIRGDESLLVSGKQSIMKGDWVRVGHKGQASIITDYFVSEIESGSRLRVMHPSEMYLDHGRVNNTASQRAEIKTDRGLVLNSLGSEVAVEVSETGETRVLPSFQKVMVYDSHNGQVLALPGEKVVLRSDTVLSQAQHVPQDLQLSRSQLEGIIGKLVIARTKALTGIENMLVGERNRAHEEIRSAEQSFRSVAQILDSGRDMVINRRVNLESVAVADIYPALAEKTDRLDILTEAYALEQLFAVLEQNKNSLAFAPVETEVPAFNRFVLLNYLASVATPEQAAALNTLAENYVVSMLRKVQQSPIKMEQLAYLNQQVDALPRNADAEKFLISLKAHLPPNLALALDEKISALF